MDDLKKHLNKLIEGELQVAVLKGGWGAGKTHFWSDYIEGLIPHQLQAVSGLRAYSYVSLFGVGSLDQVKNAICQNARFATTQTAEVGHYRKSKALIGQIFTNNAEHLKKTPGLHRMASAIDTLSYATVSDYLICIDDLERKGKGLEMRQLMGLIDELRAQKRCRVLLILNEDSLDDPAEEKQYNAYREKVIDAEFLYTPNPEDNFKLIFTSSSFGEEAAGKVLSALECNNIRIIKKIKQTLDNHKELLETSSPEVINEFALTASLLTWAYFAADGPELSPSLKDRLMRRPLGEALKLGEGEQATPQYKQVSYTRNQLSIRDSRFQTPLVKYLKQGYPDVQAVAQIRDDADKQAHRQRESEAWNSAWALFKDGFENNAESIQEKLQSLLKSEYFTRYNFDEFLKTIDFLSDIKQDTRTWVEQFIASHEDGIHRGDFDGSTNIRDPLLNAKLKAPRPLAASVSLDIDQVMKSLKFIGLRDEEFHYLAQRNVDELHGWMKSSPPDLYAKLTKALIKMDPVNFTDEDLKKTAGQIGQNLHEALRRIAKESDLNRLRVAELYPSVRLD